MRQYPSYDVEALFYTLQFDSRTTSQANQKAEQNCRVFIGQNRICVFRIFHNNLRGATIVYYSFNAWTTVVKHPMNMSEESTITDDKKKNVCNYIHEHCTIPLNPSHKVQRIQK